MNSYELDVVFLGIDWTDTSLDVVRQIKNYRRKTAIIGCAADCPPDGLRRAVAAGVSTLLVPPFSAEDLEKALAAGVSSPQSKLTGNVFAFLSAKGGDGATTVGLNVAGSCASRNKKVLFLEADLDSGVASTLMNIAGSHSILDTLESAELLDDTKWSVAVMKTETFDMLPVPVAWRPAEFSKWSYYRLLTFARERYDTMVVDLPAVVNDAAEAILTHAKALYLVCSAEIPSLLLARRRICALEARGLAQVPLVVAVNRFREGGMNVATIEKVLERPVGLVFPESHAEVADAILHGRLVRAKSKLGQAFDSFGAELAGTAPPTARAGMVAEWTASISKRFRHSANRLPERTLSRPRVHR